MILNNLMFTVHLISDLNLDFNEFSISDESLPDVDLVIINGNIGHLKRGMLYAETLCKKYPNTHFIYNLGESELYINAHEKYIGELKEQLKVRQYSNSSWPVNLHYSDKPILLKLRNGIEVDILCLYGFPKIHKTSIDWNQTNWYKFYTAGMISHTDNIWGKFKPQGTSDVNHGGYPCMADIDWVNSMHLQEESLARNWELTNNNAKKILVTHINQYKDIRLTGQTASPYLIHLHNQYWLSSNTPANGVQFLGSNYYSNPGRGAVPRSKIIVMK